MDNTNNKDKNRVFLLKTTLFGKLITSFIIAIIYKLPQPLFAHCDRGGKKNNAGGVPMCLPEIRKTKATSNATHPLQTQGGHTGPPLRQMTTEQ